MTKKAFIEVNERLNQGRRIADLGHGVLPESEVWGAISGVL